jgi:hypothetical protein
MHGGITTKYTNDTNDTKKGGRKMTEIIYKQESYDIIGACFEVYKEKGNGFLEPVYQKCLEIELRLRGIQFLSQSQLPIHYKGTLLRQRYIPDFILFGKSFWKSRQLPR